MFFRGGKGLTLQAVLILMALASTAEAAILSGASGLVYVDSGAGYRLAQVSMALAPGNTVMVTVGGHAQITFNGCTVRLEFGDIYVVPQDSPCVQASGPGFDTALVVGTLAVAGGVAAAVALSSGESANPVSAGGGGGGGP